MTVFQPEKYAIELAVTEDLQEGYLNKDIYIFFDSQAALKAHTNTKVTCKMVYDCIAIYCLHLTTGFGCQAIVASKEMNNRRDGSTKT